MTEVSKMTDQQLNRELAELMGWINIREDGFGGFWGQPADDRWSNALPAYCTDPAASLEVEKAAINADSMGYVLNLSLKTSSPKHYMEWENHELEGFFFSAKAVSIMLTATPRQRAEAAYMTLKGD